MEERQIDALLVERAQKGETKAFELLVSKYQRRLTRLLSRFIKNQNDIDDVAQETFIKAFRALPTFRGECAFYTWLYRIAINTAKNYLTSSDRRLLLTGDVADEDGASLDAAELVPDLNTPEAELMKKEMAKIINDAVSSLNDDLKRAITLREMEGLSYEEIAEVMDCPIGTVRSRIFRAREVIAERLRPLLGTSEKKRW
ncbi:MAG: RNA polymerase sigma factor RpoE [Neisseriaceae bacterium]|nr:RNA polymerase sigma factor RpoE [Neisseriaceae bacterium]